MFQYRQVLVRMRQGDSDRDISRARLMGRNKAARLRVLASEQGWLSPQGPLPEDAAIVAAVGTARRARSTVSSVEPHRAQVERWLDQGVSGVAIHAALCRNHGYSGSYSAVRRMVSAIQASLPPQATVRLDFAPGEAAQVDFGAGPFLIDPASNKRRRAWCFVMTLCWSRHQYVEFVWDQTAATWLGCHRRAFEWFASVPARLIIDNPKCAITKACMHDPLVQRAYAECAEGYAFRIEACPPADPAKKGIVESGVKYVKGNFLPTRSFRDLTDLNDQARRWVLEEAGVRIHGTTREQPLARFELERTLLRSLPAIAPDLGSWHRVVLHRDCHVQHERVLYSAPYTLIGKILWLRATDSCVSLFHEHQLVATHARTRIAGQRLSVPEHLPPDAQAFFAHDRAWCMRKAREVGPACAQLVEQLLSDRIVERLRAAQGVLGLLRRYEPARLEAASARALYFACPFYGAVKRILKSALDQAPLLLPIAPEQPYGDKARFARDANALFGPDVAH
jgi:transposase